MRLLKGLSLTFNFQELHQIVTMFQKEIMIISFTTSNVYKQAHFIEAQISLGHLVKNQNLAILNLTVDSV